MKRLRIGVVLCVAWLAALLISYMVAQQYLNLGLLEALGRIVVDFAAVAVLAMALIAALAPPTAWDVLTYHLAAPQHYIDVGRIAAFPENHFLGFPELMEMLNLWLLLTARPQAAALLHWTFGVLTLLLV